MKRRLGAVPCALLALGLAACGGGDQQPAQDTATPATQTPAAGTPATQPAGQPDVQLAGILPAGVTEQMVQEGRQIFNGQGICYTCHGQNGAGGPLGPALNDQEWLHVQTGDYGEIVTLVTSGVQQPKQYPGPMPARGGGQLSDDQVNAVSAYVYAISRGARL